MDVNDLSLNDVIEYADKRGVKIPTKLLINLLTNELAGDIDALKAYVDAQIKAIEIFGRGKDGLVPGFQQEDTWLSATGWRALDPPKVIQRGGTPFSHAFMYDLDYANAGHIDFAGTKISNIFTEDQEVTGMLKAVPVVGELYLNSSNVVTANSITLAAGTLTSGAVADTRTINTTYYVVQETAKFDIQFIFTGLAGNPKTVNLEGRYEGNPAHNVWIYAWNFLTSAWDRLTAAAQDFPNSATDMTYSFSMPADPTNYISGGETRIRIYHDSAAVATHYMYVDYIGIQTQTMTLASAGTFYTATNLSEGVESNIALDGANGTITITEAGIYDISAFISFTGTAGMTINCHVFINGSIEETLGFTRTIGASTSFGSASLGGKILLSADDVLTIRVTSDIPNSWASIDNLNFSVARLN